MPKGRMPKDIRETDPYLFLVILQKEIDKFERQVQAALNAGWQPVGGVGECRDGWYLGMTHKEEEANAKA